MYLSVTRTLLPNFIWWSTIKHYETLFNAIQHYESLYETLLNTIRHIQALLFKPKWYKPSRIPNPQLKPIPIRISQGGPVPISSTRRFKRLGGAHAELFIADHEVVNRILE